MTRKMLQSFWSPEFRLDDVHWRKLEQAGAITLLPDHRVALLAAMTRYREDSDGYRAAVRPGKVRPLLEEAAQAGRDFDAVLVELLRSGPAESGPAESPAAVREIAKAVAAAHKRYAGRAELKAFRAEVKRWTSYIDAALAALPKDRGREGDPHLDGLIVAAQSVFASAGGRGKYRPEALSFYRAVCGVVGHRSQSREAFQKQVQRALDKSQR